MKNHALKNDSQRLNSSEPDRLYSLKQYNILDTEGESCYDNITEMASRIFECKVAAIGFMDESRLWLKSVYGFNLKWLPREMTACNLTIQQSGVFQIQDITQHPDFSRHPLLKDGVPLRYYAAAPLISPEGYNLGTLCILDDKPRQFSLEKLSLLQRLAQDVIWHLESRKQNLITANSTAVTEPLTGRTQKDSTGKRVSLMRDTLRKQTRLFQSVLNNSPQLIAIVDEKGEYQVVNRAVSRLFGLPAHSIVGRSIKELHSEGLSLSKNLKAIEQVLRSGKPSRVFEESMTRNGAKSYYQSIVIPVQIANDVKRAMLISTDVSALKRMEVSLNEKNEELENLIYSLSHDLRGPISSILGLMNVEKYASEDDLREYFRMIQAQATKMDSSIHDLVQLKNVTKKSIVPSYVDVKAMLGRIISRYEGGRVKIHVSDTSSKKLRTDPYFVQTSLEHIIDNAVYYHSEEAEAPEVNITVANRDEGLNISVSDNGVGISASAMPRVYDMFYRGSNLSGGHGLGLYTTKNALQRIKATINIQSVENAGTEVSVYIPNTAGQSHF